MQERFYDKRSSYPIRVLAVIQLAVFALQETLMPREFDLNGN